MSKMKTTYLGLDLKNPLIAGCSSLTTNLETLEALEQSGAAAVVIGTLFEEQLLLKELETNNELEEYLNSHPEMSRLYETLKQYPPEKHLKLIGSAKDKLSIPVIASLNAMHPDTWSEYARELEMAGADAIELNLYTTPKDFEVEGKTIIQSQIEILKNIKKTLKIPVSVKVSAFYTNPPDVFRRFDKTEIQGIVLVNKQLQPDIDIEKEHTVQSFTLSRESDHRLTLQLIGLLYGKVTADLCGSTGIIRGADAVKTILAGASAFQVVSTLYQNGLQQIKTILTDIDEWMNRKGYSSIAEFKGKLAQKNTRGSTTYCRNQYIDLILGATDYLTNTSE